MSQGTDRLALLVLTLRQAIKMSDNGQQLSDGVNSLMAMVATHEIRDYDWATTGLYELLFDALQVCWQRQQLQRGQAQIEEKFWHSWEYCLEAPEFDDSAAARIVSYNWVTMLADRIVFYATNSPDNASHALLRHAKHCFHWLYRKRVDYRGDMRRLLGNKLLSLGAGPGRGRDGGTTRFHLPPLLDILRCILAGIRDDSDAASWTLLSRNVLHRLLLPLHAPSEMIEWRDQIPILQTYHEPLVRCLAELIGKEKARATGAEVSQLESILVQSVLGLLRAWPEGFTANTPKEVLLLHEIEALVVLAADSELPLLMRPLLDRLARSIGSDADNVRPAQRALQMFKNAAFVRAVSLDLGTALDALLPALYRGGQLSWNPTINKMTGLALRKLQSIDEQVFAAAANRHFSDSACVSSESKQKKHKSATGSKDDASSSSSAGVSEYKPPLPPSAKIPPRGPVTTNSLASFSSSDWRPRSGVPPPVTVTGVAPWAVGVGVGGAPRGVPFAVMPKQQQQPSSRSRLILSPDDQESGMDIDVKEAAESKDGSGVAKTGLEVLLKFVDRCLPAEEVTEDATSDWNTMQAAPSPTLLPSLRFHDLVFGKTLGVGAFGTVRYARHIRRDRPQSGWAEYAVKVVSAQRLHELNYYAAVEREMAVLQLLSHPGVCRLVSAFRYTGSAYLVLEYAARGDLHTYLLSLRKGMPQLAARFVLGEVTAALLSLHDLGLSYCDLKPENVLLTQLGHVKLADFGACRAVTPAAKELLAGSRDRLGCLRNGDWREEPASVATSETKEMDWLGRIAVTTGAEENEGEEKRLEGTPAYLPPEVLQGLAAPGLGGDAWALGCLAHFCLSGRPPFFGSREEVLQQMKDEDNVFSIAGAPSDDQHNRVRFSNAKQQTGLLDESAQKFIAQLLHRDPLERLTVLDASSHPFLLQGSAEPPIPLSPLKLHMGEPVTLPLGKDTGGAAVSGMGEDQLWARRQFSVLWAPMPQEYDLAVGDHQAPHATRHGPSARPYTMETIEETAAECDCCFVSS